jgi:hypothetical protein
MGVIKLALYCFAGVGAWTALTSIALWFRDRSGNSGRDTHWTTNPRIRAPSEEEMEWAKRRAKELNLP